MLEKQPADGPPVTRKKYTPAFKAACIRQVAAGARLSSGLRSAEREEIKRLRAELKRVEIEHDMLKKAVTLFAQHLP